MYGIIYLVTNKINGKTYIGQTIRKWPIRMKEHINFPDESSAIDQAIKKYNPENFKWDILESNIKTQKMLNFLERFYIVHHNSYKLKWGYNIREGGSNGKLSKETRKKLSNSLKGKMSGNKHPLYGKCRNIETRKKISKAIKGKNHPFYGKVGKEASNYGNKHSLKTRKKMSKSSCGKYRGTYYVNKTQNPWTKVWCTRIRFNGYRMGIGYFNDPISGEIVYDFCFREIYE